MTGTALWPSLLATWLTLTPVPASAPGPVAANPAPPASIAAPPRRD